MFRTHIILVLSQMHCTRRHSSSHYYFRVLCLEILLLCRLSTPRLAMAWTIISRNSIGLIRVYNKDIHGNPAISSSVWRLRAVDDDSNVDEHDLQEMDVVIFSYKRYPSSRKRQLGAVQEDGRITPVCVWTMEPAYGDSLEFLVHENDLPGFAVQEVHIHSVVPQSALYYGSRQVGGGMGPDNPHGEISERLYYVDRSVVLKDDIEVVLRPELEIFW
jgi:hypothetical protein